MEQTISQKSHQPLSASFYKSLFFTSAFHPLFEYLLNLTYYLAAQLNILEYPFREGVSGAIIHSYLRV
jgi:hypothetical protein